MVFQLLLKAFRTSPLKSTPRAQDFCETFLIKNTKEELFVFLLNNNN